MASSKSPEESQNMVQYHPKVQETIPNSNISEKWGELSSIKNSNVINLEIYSDEIKRVKLELDGSTWMYLGALFLPIEAKGYYLNSLYNQRCIKNGDWHQDEKLCPYPCGYHDKNNTEIHYKKLHRTNARFRIAENWIKEIISRVPIGDSRKLYLNILGLNLSKMNLQLFGEDNNRDMAIYNRFYRTLLLSGINYFLKDYKVIINNIYHDMGEQSSNKLFPWHSIRKIDIENEKVTILHKEIQFIDSDHRKSNMRESNFIQLLDLVLGATFCCLHNPSDADNKRKIGKAFKPTLKKLLDRKKAPNSSALIGDYYKSEYRRTYQVSFFPKDGTEIGNDLTQFNIFGEQRHDLFKRNGFYYDRPIILGKPKQEGLEKWL
jgi:hypothetical protein